jgi:hypothetical protein
MPGFVEVFCLKFNRFFCKYDVNFSKEKVNIIPEDLLCFYQNTFNLSTKNIHVYNGIKKLKYSFYGILSYNDKKNIQNSTAEY